MSVVRTISTGRRSSFRLKRSKLLVRPSFKPLGNNSNLIFFVILSIVLMLLSLHKQLQLSSSIDQFKSRVSLLESIIEKSNLEPGSKVEDIAERLESIIEKSNHEWGNKVESIVKILESMIEKSNHKWGSKVEGIAETLESITEKSSHEKGRKNVHSMIEKIRHEWGIKDEDISETKKMNLEKEEIITSTHNKNEPNQKWIPALKIQLLNFLTSKIREAFLVSIKTIVTIVEKSLSSVTPLIKDSYNCLKPYIIGLLKITLRLLIELGKVIVSLTIIVIKVSIQLLIGIGKTLVSLTSLVIKMIMWYLTGGLAR